MTTLAIATVCLSGALDEKFEAIAAAGFVNRVRSMITGKESIPVQPGATTP